MDIIPEFGKICITCWRYKPFSEYYEELDKRDGLSFRCKSCCNLIKEKLNEYKIRQKLVRGRDNIKQRRWSRRYYLTHKEYFSEYMKRYSRTPNGKHSMSRANHKRRTNAENVINDLTLEQWGIILKAQKNRCSGCNKRFTSKFPPEKDHIIPLSKGGGLTFENVQALCRSCNASKHAILDYSKIITW